MVGFSRKLTRGCGTSPRIAIYNRRTKNEMQYKKWQPRDSARGFRLGSSLRLRSGRSQWTATTSHAFAKLLALLRGHVLPALPHAATPVHVPARATTKSAEQDLAQKQEAHRLPEVDQMQAEQRRHQRIPQAHDDKTKHCDEHYGEQRDLQSL